MFSIYSSHCYCKILEKVEGTPEPWPEVSYVALRGYSLLAPAGSLQKP